MDSLSAQAVLCFEKVKVNAENSNVFGCRANSCLRQKINTFSTVILRPSISALFKFVMQAVACSGVSNPINPKPLDSRVRGSVTSLILAI